MAIIKLDNMQFYSSHGCYVQEQRVGGRFEVNLTVEYDSKVAERSDDVSQTVNYLALYDCVRTQMAITSHILEHVARRILDALQNDFPALSGAQITITKLAPPLGGQLRGVSVTLEM